MERLLEIFHSSEGRNWSIDFYSLREPCPRVMPREVSIALEDNHRDRIVEFPTTLRVSLCLLILGPSERLFLLSRGLINSRVYLKDIAPLLRANCSDLDYVTNFETAVKFNWG